MFDDLTLYQKELVFQGLRWLIETNSGIGFHNNDQGHPFYALGAKTGSSKMIDTDNHEDSPERNQLFQMLSELLKERVAREDTEYIWWYDFSTWQSFCKFAYDYYFRNWKVKRAPGCSDPFLPRRDRKTQTVRFDEIGIDKLLKDKPILYRIVTEEGIQNYVGVAETYCIHGDIAAHLNRIPGAFVRVERFDHIDKAREKQANILRRIHPPFND